MLTLAGCATSGGRSALPPIPLDIKLCFDTAVAAPKPGAMTKADVIKLVAALKLSDDAKTECGRRLIVFYESMAA